MRDARCLPRRVTADDVATLEAQLAAELPGFRVAYKEDSRLQRAIGRLVRPFNATYMTHYTTVLFGVVWFPSRSWRARVGPRGIYEILLHEAVHLRDARRFPGLFHLSYLCLPLPVGVTARAWWEWRAYKESLRVQWALDGAIDDATLEFIAERFTGPDYLYMWPFPGHIRRLLRAERARLSTAPTTSG